MESTSTGKLPSFIKAVLITAIIAGTLDMIGAIISYTANGGKNPIVIFQYIASAVFGKGAFNGSFTMILAGVFFHYLIAFIFTLFFFLLFPKVKLLSANSILVAMVYGIFVWAVMNRIVIPLTRLDPVSFDITKASIAAFILIVCIGLPIVFGAKKYYRKFA